MKQHCGEGSIRGARGGWEAAGQRCPPPRPGPPCPTLRSAPRRSAPPAAPAPVSAPGSAAGARQMWQPRCWGCVWHPPPGRGGGEPAGAAAALGEEEMVTELYKQTRTIQNILRTNLSIMNCFKNTRRKLYMAEAVFSERRGLRIFGCPQETIDGFILDDGCNQLKSAFTGFSEPVRKN
ncbi:uncharacterized protein [Ciconia boyciana]|uniref:uncharacterized protein isoform X2 n=1 Tax=Ciconia boyciana TaxID=52775 RepID=UPI003BA2E951